MITWWEQFGGDENKHLSRKYDTDSYDDMNWIYERALAKSHPKHTTTSICHTQWHLLGVHYNWDLVPPRRLIDESCLAPV